MPLEIFLSFLLFVEVSAITPGPANLTSLGTSIQYGRKIALRQWLGLLSGCILDASISALLVYFLGSALNNYVKWLAFAGCAYLVWFALHILRQNYQSDSRKLKTPGFLTGFLLQITNVKVLMTCITALTSYVLPTTREIKWLLISAAALSVMQPFSNLIWLFTGAALQKFFIKYTKIVNIVMASLLLLCALSLAVVPFRNY